MSTVQRFHKDNGFVTTALRSKMMGSIRAAETKPEQFLRRLIWNTGLRYRKNVKKLPGRPDIVFLKYKLAVFVDGDFWHGHNWQEKKERIKTNREFWIPKIERNMQRDKENTARLEALGFKVIRFWEHEVKNNAYTCLIKIINKLKSKE